MIETLLGPMLGQSLSAFTIPVGGGCKKWARERAFTQGQVGKILDGTVTADIDETLINGSTGTLSNVSALDAVGAAGAYPIITVCNDVAGIAVNAEGHWVPYGRCKALVKADATIIVHGRILRLDLTTPEHCFVLDDTLTRGVGYGYVLEHKAVTVIGTQYLIDVWFSAIPFIADVA